MAYESLSFQFVQNPTVRTLWDYDPTTGFIILDFSESEGGGKLAADYANGKVAAEKPRWSCVRSRGPVAAVEHLDSPQVNYVDRQYRTRDLRPLR